MSKEITFIIGNIFNKDGLTPVEASAKKYEAVLAGFRDSNKPQIREVYNKHIQWRHEKALLKSLNGNGKKSKIN